MAGLTPAAVQSAGHQAPIVVEREAQLTNRERHALAQVRVLEAARWLCRALAGEAPGQGAAARAAGVAGAVERLARAVEALEQAEQRS